MFAKMADLLGVSIDYLLLRTDKPKPVSGSDTGMTWKTGTPTEYGMYETRAGVGMEETPQTASWSRLEWTSEGWTFPVTHKPLDPAMKVFRWVKLPEV